MAGAMDSDTGALLRAQLPGDEVERWRAAEPRFVEPSGADTPSYRRDCSAATSFWGLGDSLLERLPPRPDRSEAEQVAAAVLHHRAREVHSGFLRAHVATLYGQLTGNLAKYVRAQELVERAAEAVPGLTPSKADLEAERRRPLKEKEGFEIDQGLFISNVLAEPRAGAHLVHAMLRPRAESPERLEGFKRAGIADLGCALVERVGNVGCVYLRNTAYLNAEDDNTNEALETAIDLVLLDPQIEVGVLRGAPVEHPRYAGRRIFNAGLNLTHLYQGKLSFMFYLTRDLGLVNKLYRGLSGQEFWPDGPEATLEKPWIAAVEGFAIGGGCQLLLVMDHVLAEADAYFNLPARKEGIIPGAANLRLPRFVGDRLARQAIMFDRQFQADSPEGRLLCDEVVPTGSMGAAIDRATRTLTSSGLVSAAANRKALRAGQEPLAVFQAYMATYAREQAYCHFSPALIRNLEEYWVGRERGAN